MSHVVSEFFANVFRSILVEKIHGIIYPSALRSGAGGKNVILFPPGDTREWWFAGGIQVKRTPNSLSLAHGRIPVMPSYPVNETAMQQMPVSITGELRRTPWGSKYLLSLLGYGHSTSFLIDRVRWNGNDRKGRAEGITITLDDCSMLFAHG